MATNTTTYSFQKPTVGGDEDAWGGYLNANWDSVDDLLDGTTAVTGIDINSGSIDGTPIGATTASTGAFTTMTVSSTFTLGGTAVTSTAAELNLLDGVTATTAEINFVDGVTSNIQTQLDAKVGSSYTGDVDITGELIVDSYNETYGAVTSTTNATTVNCEAGNAFSHTLTENTTFTFSNPPASGTAYSFSLEIIQDASASGYTVTWPSSVDWPAATAPTLTATASAKDVFVFYTRDGGTTWYGFTAGQALA